MSAFNAKIYFFGYLYPPSIVLNTIILCKRLNEHLVDLHVNKEKESQG